jgi:hypothetical protein
LIVVLAGVHGFERFVEDARRPGDAPRYHANSVVGVKANCRVAKILQHIPHTAAYLSVGNPVAQVRPAQVANPLVVIVAERQSE